MRPKLPTSQISQSDDLTTTAVSSVAEALNGVLSDSYALYIKTKNFHWHVSGPHFHDYHLLFEAQANQILNTTDQIAERVRKNGYSTLRSIGAIARQQRIKDNDALYVAPAEMLAELHHDNSLLVRTLRDAKALAEAAHDNATSGIIDEWTDLAEERAWFLFQASRPG